MKKILFLVLGIAAIASVFAVPYFIKVKVSCQSQYGSCSPEIESKLKSFDGTSVRQAQSGIKKAVKDMPMVSAYSSHFRLPNLLVINIIIKKPVFAVFDPEKNINWLVDENGEVLSSSETTLLPTVVVSEPLERFKKVIDRTLFALKIMGGVYEMYQVQKGEISGDSLVIELPPRFKVTFPLEGDTQVLLGELRLTYAKASSDENLGTYSQIDLRFKNPVLR